MRGVFWEMWTFPFITQYLRLSRLNSGIHWVESNLDYLSSSLNIYGSIIKRKKILKLVSWLSKYLSN